MLEYTEIKNTIMDKYYLTIISTKCVYPVMGYSYRGLYTFYFAILYELSKTYFIINIILYIFMKKSL